MFIAYCCVLIAACLPYLWTVIAKSSVPGYNNKDPRGWIARQDSYRVRNAYNATTQCGGSRPALPITAIRRAGFNPPYAGSMRCSPRISKQSRKPPTTRPAIGGPCAFRAVNK
ncbi:MAG: hypothetical protein ACK4FW_04270 [Stenotrophomonas sp.]